MGVCYSSDMQYMMMLYMGCKTSFSFATFQIMVYPKTSMIRIEMRQKQIFMYYYLILLSFILNRLLGKSYYIQWVSWVKHNRRLALPSDK